MAREFREITVQSEVGDTRDRADARPGHTPASRGPGPFVYASGSRPLAGYSIKRGVGHGGFGEIYYATSDAGKEVALKLVRRNLEIELRGIRQCLNLKHLNLLDLYDIRQDDRGDTWVVMEYAAGPSLEAVLADHPHGLPPNEVLAWFHGIAAGVAYLHDRGIVHRDLKPGNVFCDQGVVKIGDYGLSKFIAASRRSGQTESVGTVHYMAPEVAHGRYGKELDIYALGVMLYEMLTGNVPFEGQSVGEVLMKHLTAQPDVSVLAEPYRGVVARALQKDPAKRFASVGEMLAALPPGAATVGAVGAVGAAGPAAAAPAANVSADRATIEAEPLPEPPEEPVARAVSLGWQKVRAAWADAGLVPAAKVLSLPIKIIFVVAGALGLLFTAQFWIPLVVLLGLAYLLYRGVRFVYLALFGAASPAGQRRAAARDRPPGGAAAEALQAKAPRTRLTELVGSLLTSAAAAMVMSVVMVLIYSFARDTTPRPEQWAWLLLVGMGGSWAVLVPAKFWEGRSGEAMLRRFVLMIVGLGLGMAASCAAEALLVTLLPGTQVALRWPPLGQALGASMPAPPHLAQVALHAGDRLPRAFYATGGEPLTLAYVAALGTLFLLVRWWLQADPLRPVRLSLRSVLLSCIAAAIVAAGWRFPQPWLVMVAGIMSVSVQLSSPWVPLHQRLRPQRKMIV
jgi:hypothetical protein